MLPSRQSLMMDMGIDIKQTLAEKHHAISYMGYAANGKLQELMPDNHTSWHASLINYEDVVYIAAKFRCGEIFYVEEEDRG